MLGRLLALRYRLIWAQARTRRGKLAVFFTAYFLVGTLIALMAIGGWRAALAVLDTLPPRSRAKPAAAIEWDGPCDRIASRFGPYGPLVSKHMRYFLRSNRVRMSYLMSLPLFPVLFAIGTNDPVGAVMQRWLIALAGVMGTFVVAINLFGYDGDGFRRYLPQRHEPLAARLDEQQPLARVLDGALPAIDAAHAGHDVDAGRDARLDQAARYHKQRQGDTTFMIRK